MITGYIKALVYMSHRVCATGHIKCPVPLIEKSRVSFLSGRFPPSFINATCNHHAPD